MVNRRQFLGGALAVAAAGPAIARGAAAGRSPEVDFYALGDVGGVGVVGGMGQLAGRPDRVELRSLEVGHFHGLVHEGDGRVAYLYLATLAGPSPRRGLVKVADAGVLATA